MVGQPEVSTITCQAVVRWLTRVGQPEVSTITCQAVVRWLTWAGQPEVSTMLLDWTSTWYSCLNNQYCALRSLENSLVLAKIELRHYFQHRMRLIKIVSPYGQNH